MSGAGSPEQLEIDGTGLRVVVIAALWHEQVMTGLLDGALAALANAGVTDVRVIRVPGTIELSVAAAKVAATGVDAIVALGVVIKGGTPHFDYVCQSATFGLTQVAVQTGVPVGFGVLTCDNEVQAFERAGLHNSREDKGGESALAAIGTAVALRELTAD